MRTVLGAKIALLAMCVTLSASPASAADGAYPSRAVTIVVPASAGTGADVVARLVGQRLAELWGQPVIVENKDGASGSIGAAMVAHAPADGYTLCMAFLNHAISPSLYSNIPFDILKDFKPIVRTTIAPMVIVSNPSFPPNTVGELIRYAKSKTGSDAVFFGSPGMGSVNGLSLEMLKQKAGFNMTQAPYKGNAQMVTDIVGNQISLGAAVIAAVQPQIKAGKLKAIAVTSKKRSSSLPDVPTVAEAGIADYDVAAWNGLLAPANTPDAIVAEVYAKVSKVAEAPEFRRQLGTLGLELALLNPAEFKAYLASEVSQWAKVVKESGIKAE
ncbi:tripartite tricarboxylate transporter substrate binding protein [soil metagenome]